MHGCGSFALVTVGVLGWGGVDAQYNYDGAEVAMECGDCTCIGASDDGEIKVVDNPLSGDRIAYFDDAYYEILETTCGSSVIAVDTNLYELTGVYLRTRVFDEMEMDDSDCHVDDTPSTAECFVGASSNTLDDGVELTLTLCLCRFESDDDERTMYTFNVVWNIKSDQSVVAPEEAMVICTVVEPRAQLVTVVVEDTEYFYNFGLVMSGETSFGDLDLLPAPTSEADDIVCGTGGTETMSSPSSSSTSSSSSLSSATEPPTPEPTPVPTPALTPAPTPAPTPLVVDPTPPPTHEPPKATPAPSPVESKSPPTAPPATVSHSPFATSFPSTSPTDGEEPEPKATSEPEVTSPTEGPAAKSATTSSPIMDVNDASTREPVATSTPSTASIPTLGPTVTDTNTAPTATAPDAAVPTSPGAFGTGEFEDKNMKMTGREGLAFTGLAFFTILTFLPAFTA